MPPASPGSSALSVPGVTGSCGSTSRWEAQGSAAPASRARASRAMRALRSLPRAGRHRDDQGRPLCANCFITDPANQETCIGCGRRRRVERRTADGPLCSRCPALPVLTCSTLPAKPRRAGISRMTGLPWCPACQHRQAACSACGMSRPGRLGHHGLARCAPAAPRPHPGPIAPPAATLAIPRPGRCARCLVSKAPRRLDGSCQQGTSARGAAGHSATRSPLPSTRARPCAG